MRRARARILIPRAAVLARPLQHLEVAAPRRVRALPVVPRAVVLIIRVAFGLFVLVTKRFSPPYPLLFEATMPR